MEQPKLKLTPETMEFLNSQNVIHNGDKHYYHTQVFYRENDWPEGVVATLDWKESNRITLCELGESLKQEVTVNIDIPVEIEYRVNLINYAIRILTKLTKDIKWSILHSN